ncbi:tyrosine-type recombinase/integrase [Robiginitalea marina]|uniref:Site-specific integrase n=1 Tax=Robiginitalea marina TaxID=2954105 RepID=A0ABT1B127_9FLAO|nr:site-specific integrase [Robiginitalea marina]MCO5725555.1 site-specific integrase [Robiginitalea marina]
MANIKYLVKSKKNPAAIYVRFYQGRGVDITSNTSYIVNPKQWSKRLQQVTNTAGSTLDQVLNPKLKKLKDFIVAEYNEQFADGGNFDKNWLDRTVAKFNNRPKDNLSDPNVFFIPFIEKFIDESKSRINPNTGKIISRRTIQKYETTLVRLKEFELLHKIRIKLWDIDLEFHKAFLSFLKLEGNYGNTTIAKYLTQIKAFCREAKTLGLKVSSEFEHRNFTARAEKTIDVYLKEKEIDLIFKHDFSDNPRLNNARQLMIIGLWTGLRISDLKNIHTYNITNEEIQILDSKKTGGHIIIPIHPQIKSVLLENNGELPKTISDQKFNKYVKEVCEEVGIKEEVIGKKMNPETKRKEKGYYPKYELVTSHTCRRSFATNLYGKLPNQTIMAITNHISEQQFINYVKTTQEEHVERVREYFNRKNK